MQVWKWEVHLIKNSKNRQIHLRFFSCTQSPNHGIEASTFNYNSRISCAFPKTKPLEVHTAWLRHHCRCKSCYNHKTNQRTLIPSLLPKNSTVLDFNIENSKLSVTWNDGHSSQYNKEWLLQSAPRPISDLNKFLQIKNCILDKEDSERFLTTENVFGKLRDTSNLQDPLNSAVPYKEFMAEGDDGVSRLLSSIIKDGYGIVNECPATFEATKEIVRKVSHPQTTIYGDFYEWTSNLLHADTAYTSDVVHMHTDTTYFTEPIGLQIFHCLKHEGTGGINWLVDGRNIAERILQSNPSIYSLLANVSIPCEYIDVGKHHFSANDVTFAQNQITGHFEKIRYNPHDMGVLAHLPLENVAKFYESLVHLSDQLESDPIQIRLTPGLVIFLDNWRTLHGRSSYTGYRHMCGTYISRSDWLSRARTLRLLNE